jgi:competence CoiA-like predicted nuclease
MFKAKNIQTNQEIVILDPQWWTQIPQLKALAKTNTLVCQGSNQPVLVLLGTMRRCHVAHKDLQNCA